jgi:hypothetical protein
VDQAEMKKQAISIVKRFGGALKPELKKAIQTGGPAHAISVCSQQAPAIAQELSDETGWLVKRVSLKARNRQSAIPDAWETKVLQQFDSRQENGEPVDKMAYAEVVDGKFRFMKAQAMETVCMNCHASSVSADVESELNEKYPDDKARGYTLGQIRGAFSLSRDI